MRFKNITPLTCSEAQKLFNDYIDNFLEGTSKERLLDHLEECRHCFDRLEFENKLKAKVAASGNAENAEMQEKLSKILSTFFG